MRREHCAALFDRGNEAIGRAPGLDCGHQRADRIVPNRCRDLVVDPGVGNNLYLTLGCGGEDEDAGTVLGLVDPLR